MSSALNPRSNIVQRNWKPAVLPAASNCALSGRGDENARAQAKDAPAKDAPAKEAPASAAFDVLREQQVLYANSFTREFQNRKLIRQFLSKTHSLGSTGPPVMVVSHRFRVDVVSTDARFVAGFTLARGHRVRLLAPEHVTWDKGLCSSSVELADGGNSRNNNGVNVVVMRC